MRSALVLIAVLAAAAPARADDTTRVRAHTISIDPVLGALGFTGRNIGEWTLGYEHRIDPQHALVVEQSTVHVHKDPFHLTTFALGLGYRYYLRPSGTSPFLGAFAGGKLGTGRYGTMEPNGMTAHAVFITAHAGWRRTFPSGFTLAARIGAGWAKYHLGDGAPHAAHEVQRDRLSPLPFELDTELSVGRSF